MENGHLARSSLDAQIKEAKSRAEQFSKSLQDAREQEAIALKLLEQERERWTHSFEEKSILIEQLERELTSTVEALDVERSTDKFNRSNFADGTNASNTFHETTKLNNLPRSVDIREINYNEMNKSMHDIITDVNNYQPNQTDIRFMNESTNQHNYHEQQIKHKPNLVPAQASTEPMYYNTTSKLASTNYNHNHGQQVQQQPQQQPFQQQARPTVSHSYHAPPMQSSTTTTPSLSIKPSPALALQSEDVTVWRDLLAQYQEQLKVTKTELHACTEQKDNLSRQNECLNKEVKQLIEEKELFATACDNAEGKLKFRVSQIIQYEEEKNTLEERITTLTALNRDLQNDLDTVRHDLEVTKAELHIVTQRVQIEKQHPRSVWKHPDSTIGDESSKLSKQCVSTATQCSSDDDNVVQYGAPATAASARRATQATEAYIKDLHRQLEETHASYEEQLNEVRQQVSKMEQRVRSAEQQAEQSHQLYVSAEEAKERYRVERDALLTMVSKLHLNTTSTERPTQSSANRESERYYHSTSYSAGAAAFSGSYDQQHQQQQLQLQQQYHDANHPNAEASNLPPMAPFHHHHYQQQNSHATSSGMRPAERSSEQSTHHRSNIHLSHPSAPNAHTTTASTLAAPIQAESTSKERTDTQVRCETPKQQLPSATTAAIALPTARTEPMSSVPATSGELYAVVDPHTQSHSLNAAPPHTEDHASNPIDYHSEGSSGDSEEEDSLLYGSEEESSDEDVETTPQQGHRADQPALATSTSNVLNMSDGPHAEAHSPAQALAARQAHIASMLVASNQTPATHLIKKSNRNKTSNAQKKTKKESSLPLRCTPPSSKQQTGASKSGERSSTSMVIRQPPSYTGASNDRFVRGGVDHGHTVKGHKTSITKGKSLTSKSTGSSNSKQVRPTKSSAGAKQKKLSTTTHQKTTTLENSSTAIAATTTAAVNQLYIPARFSDPADISWVSETAAASTEAAGIGVPSTEAAAIGWKEHTRQQQAQTGLGESYELVDNALDGAGLHLTSREHFYSYGHQPEADEISESSSVSEEAEEEVSDEEDALISLPGDGEDVGVTGQVEHSGNMSRSDQHQQLRPEEEYRGGPGLHYYEHQAGLAPHPHVLPDGEEEDSDALNHCMVVQRVPDKKVLGGINFHEVSHTYDHPPPLLPTTTTNTNSNTSNDVHAPSTTSIASDLSSTHLSLDDDHGRPKQHSQFTGVTDIKISRKSQPNVDLTRSASANGGGSARSSAEKATFKSKSTSALKPNRGSSRARTPSPMPHPTTAATGSNSLSKASKYYTPTSYSTRRSSSGVVPVVTPTSTLRTTGSTITGKLLSGKSKGINSSMHNNTKAKTHGASRQRTLLF